MHHNHILKSLPLLASILGRKYGVQVNIGGDSAYTNGNIIQLPALPLDGDVTLLGLARGYIDHESAHIRSTDFEALKAANLTPLEKHIWNIIEDWRVENALSASTGCSSPCAPGTSRNYSRNGIRSELLRKSIIRA